MGIEIKIDSSLDKLKRIRDFVSNIIGENMLKDQKDMVVLAVDEVCSNMINYSSGETNISLRINFDSQKKAYVFQVKNIGVLFDYPNYKEPKLEEIIKEKRRGGLGLLLVRRIMDDISFSHDGNVSTCVLTKKV